MKERVACEIITWDHIYDLCQTLVDKILDDGFRPDLIIAIARGGYIPARVLGVMQLSSIRIEHYRGSHKGPEVIIKEPLIVDVDAKPRRILLVDDVSDTGDTFQLALDHIHRQMAAAQIRTAALHYQVASNYEPDFYAGKVLQWHWITYPWAIVEDLCVFIKSMEPRPESLQGIADQLYQDQGLRVETNILERVLRIMQRQLW